LKIISHILIIIIFIFQLQWHPSEWQAWERFISNVYEHLASGDTFWDFLDKHYGNEDTVILHYKKNHPGENPFKNKTHNHEMQPLPDAAIIYYISIVPVLSQLPTHKNFIYRQHYTRLFTGRFLRPPEPSVS